MPQLITIITTRRALVVYAYMVTLFQSASDEDNDWGVDRILVLNVPNDWSDPPEPSQIAAMVRASEFRGLYVSAGGGGMIEG